MKYAAHPWRQDLHISIHHKPVALSKGPCGKGWLDELEVLECLSQKDR